MASLWRNRMSLLHQYETVIDAFDDVVRGCPQELWEASLWEVKRSDPWVWPREGMEAIPERTDESIQVFSSFWYVAVHCVFFLDFYLSGPELEDFRPPSPFEAEPGEVFGTDDALSFPARKYTSADVLAYIAHCRAKAREIIPALTIDDIKRLMPEGHPWAGLDYNRLLRVNLRHVKDHTAQMNRLLAKNGLRSESRAEMGRVSARGSR